MNEKHLAHCLRMLQWSNVDLARATGRTESTVRKWRDPEHPAQIPTIFAAWLERAAQFFANDPPPKLPTASGWALRNTE